MLRQHNKGVKVRVFLIDAKKRTKIDDFADRLDLEIVRRPATKEAVEQKYFCLNRQYLAECSEKSVLYIDGDTFIFGNVESIFDKYEHVDFAAATDEYIINSPDWNQEDLEQCYEKLNAKSVDVFNGGLTLWNGCITDWAESLPEVCTKLQNKEFHLPWLFRENRNCYHKETFSICFYVGKNKLKYELMNDQDVVNLFSWQAYAKWKKKDFIVYHTFTQNWSRFFGDLVRKKKIANFKLITCK